MTVDAPVTRPAPEPPGAGGGGSVGGGGGTAPPEAEQPQTWSPQFLQHTYKSKNMRERTCTDRRHKALISGRTGCSRLRPCPGGRAPLQGCNRRRYPGRDGRPRPGRCSSQCSCRRSSRREHCRRWSQRSHSCRWTGATLGQTYTPAGNWPHPDLSSPCWAAEAEEAAAAGAEACWCRCNRRSDRPSFCDTHVNTGVSRRTCAKEHAQEAQGADKRTHWLQPLSAVSWRSWAAASAQPPSLSWA